MGVKPLERITVARHIGTSRYDVMRNGTDLSLGYIEPVEYVTAATLTALQAENERLRAIIDQLVSSSDEHKLEATK